MKIKVCAFASGNVHLAEVPDFSLIPMTHVGSPFMGVPLPAVMLCGATLRKRYGYSVAIKMEDAVKVSCRACIRVNEFLEGHRAR